MCGLAFAVAVASDPDVLIADEILAVGDAAFARKCYARIEELRARGTTILLVTHNAGIVLELCDRAVFGTHPKGGCSDGLCMDAAGALWIASPTTHEFLRMERGGAITDRVSTGERHAIACVLGGPERRTLFCLTAATLSIRAARLSTDGRVETVRVAVPGAGTP